MRSKSWGVFVALAATVALGALAVAASASAASWYVGGSLLGSSASLATTANAGVVRFELEPGVEMQCTGGMEFKGGSITAPAAGKIEHIVWKECGYVFEAGAFCELSSHAKKVLETKALNIEAALGKGLEDTLILKPQTGNVVMEITSTGSECPTLGTIKLTGKLKFVMPNGGTGLVEQRLVLNTGSALQWESSAVQIYGEVGEKLTSGSTWSFH